MERKADREKGLSISGSPAFLGEKEVAFQNMLVDKAPNQITLPFALWTRDAVRLAIKKNLVLPCLYRLLPITSNAGDSRRKSRRSEPLHKTRKS